MGRTAPAVVLQGPFPKLGICESTGAVAWAQITAPCTVNSLSVSYHTHRGGLGAFRDPDPYSSGSLGPGRYESEKIGRLAAGGIRDHTSYPGRYKQVQASGSFVVMLSVEPASIFNKLCSIVRSSDSGQGRPHPIRLP